MLLKRPAFLNDLQDLVSVLAESGLGYVVSGLKMDEDPVGKGALRSKALLGWGFETNQPWQDGIFNSHRTPLRRTGSTIINWGGGGYWVPERPSHLPGVSQ